MLILSRKVDERIRIGDDIWLTVVKIQGDKVRIGIEADPRVRILRDELLASGVSRSDFSTPARPK